MCYQLQAVSRTPEASTHSLQPHLTGTDFSYHQICSTIPDQQLIGHVVSGFLSCLLSTFSKLSTLEHTCIRTNIYAPLLQSTYSINQQKYSKTIDMEKKSRKSLMKKNFPVVITFLHSCGKMLKRNSIQMEGFFEPQLFEGTVSPSLQGACRSKGVRQLFTLCLRAVHCLILRQLAPHHMG